MMMKCKEAGPLIEKEEFEKLSRWKKLGLGFHLSWCKICKKYQKEGSKMNKIIKLMKSKEEKKLSLSEKEQLKTSLADHDQA
jgi:hypothetical protein